MLKRLAVAVLATLMLVGPGLGGAAGDITREALYSGKLQQGLDQLAGPALSDDPEARFGTGLINFVRGIERLAQALYRHGLAAPEAGPMGPPLLLPVPPNPSPEPLDYQKLRAMLEALVADMERTSAAMEGAAASGDYVVSLDLLKFRLDINADGIVADSESVAGILAQVFGEDVMSAPAGETPTGPMANGLIPPKPREPGAIVGFDRADAIWLAGYSQVFAAQADFLLAHDFHAVVEASFHRLFPRAGLPMQDYSKGTGAMFLDPESENAIADLIAALHTTNWPVVDPERLKRVLTRFQAITQLSRRNWAAILAETDDNYELVPSPGQTPIVPDGKVTDETVAAWMETLDAADSILAGELLVPHWRFAKGFDLKAYFETATRTDLVMLLTGFDALPYLKDGPIANAESFAAANRVFGDDFLGYAFWFN